MVGGTGGMGNAEFWKGDWLFGALVAVCLLAVVYCLVFVTRCLSNRQSEHSAALPISDLPLQRALAAQGQGQLDEAHDLFRQCPMNDSLCGHLYGLALDYEARRQFDKAVSVLRHIGVGAPDFRDLPQRLARLSALAEGGGAAGQDSAGCGDATGQPKYVGRYRIERVLGRGAMGIVYLGRDPQGERLVAIKVLDLSRDFAEERVAEAKSRLLHEAATAQRLRHPDIVAIFEAGETGNLSYIVMEFAAGDDLVPYTRPDHLLPLATVIAIGERVATVLDYAHRQQVIHRDIKPANILFEPESGQVKVMDFGIAAIAEGVSTRSGAIIGTPAFMSPEQVQGKVVDGRSDIYSLGVTLFQLCTGRVPFVGESMAELMYRIANEQAPALDAMDARIPHALAAIVECCLAKDQRQRYQRGADLARDLRACMDAGAGTMAPIFKNSTHQG